MDKKLVMGVMMVLMVISLVFAIWGVKVHVTVRTEEAKFHDLQSKYLIWITQPGIQQKQVPI